MTRARTIADYAKQTTDLATQTELDAAETALGFQSVPHIIPGVLYPSYVASGTSNKLLDGTTSHSGAFGTAQSDGRKYYYTNIAGSKPIKDPRIGGHFGSQRHITKSLQKLEQESSTNGTNVYSVDGRGWIRAVDKTGKWVVGNDDNGIRLGSWGNTSEIASIEIVGYFNDMTITGSTETSDRRSFVTSLNGSANSSENASYKTAANTPLSSRYVDRTSLVHLNLPTTHSSTLGINTLKISNHADNDYLELSSIELIAQDKFTDSTCDYNNDPTITHNAYNTPKILKGMSVSGTGIPAGATVASVTSTTEFELSVATTGGSVTNGTLTFGAENIQIPSQNVVSYGKKFTVSGIPHYNPFAHNQLGTAVGIGNTTSHGSVATGWAGTGSGYYDDTLDTATSLGLSAWVQNSKYYRPVNGGRVVKWVDSSGNIKTSVNMMPPAGTSMHNSSSVNLPESTNWTSVYQPLFSSTTHDHSQAEIAKTFHWREFGNGGANGNANYLDASQYKDASAVSIAYVMDDGLSSLNGNVNTHNLGYGISLDATSKNFYLTFIGTGISWISAANAMDTGGHMNWAQNLPYGTHVIKFQIDGTNVWDGVVYIDGVDIKNDFGSGSNQEAYKFPPKSDIFIHQPKKPPIPEDAVVLADYMLMADYVKQTHNNTGSEISKGCRTVGGSRDVFYDDPDGSFTSTVAIYPYNVLNGLRSIVAAGTNSFAQLPFFGTSAQPYIEEGGYASHVIDFGGSSDVDTTEVSSSLGQWCEKMTIDTSATLGLNTVKATIGFDAGFFGFDVITPTHTSSHYQAFEMPLLKELVGGDRNMEQTNLVVTPDGKTWDQVTRDTSYLGSSCYLNVQLDDSDSGTSAYTSGKLQWTVHRGGATTDHRQNKANKGFAYGWDKFIILEDGLYNIICQTYSNAENVDFSLKINNASSNGSNQITAMRIDPADETAYVINNIDLKRGDYLVAYVNYSILVRNTLMRITKIEAR